MLYSVDGLLLSEHESGSESCPKCWPGYPVKCQCGGMIHAEWDDCTRVSGALSMPFYWMGEDDSPCLNQSCDNDECDNMKEAVNALSV